MFTLMVNKIVWEDLNIHEGSILSNEAKKFISESKLKRSSHIKIEDKDRVLTLFYAKWCSFSQRFLPIFNAYKQSNPTKCLSFTLDDNSEICKEFSIKYYPTVIMFKNGKVEKRLDSKPGIGLDKEQLENFIKKQ